ncbi:MAG: FHA domain-containing protein [Candidatus Eremiobacteraeota bacterium]|nr:FHA domain-containing protein [Candidatus Eremiobacteraeota bacterium]
MDRDMLNNLRGGLGLASRLVGRSFDEVTKAIGKGEEGTDGGETGLYFVSGHPVMSAKPRLGFLEPQLAQRFNINFLKNLTMSGAERSFVDALRQVVSHQHDAALAKLKSATGSSRDAKVGLTDAFFTLGALHIHRGEYKDAVTALKTGLLAQQGLGKTLVRYLPSFHVAIPLTPTSQFCLFPDLVGLNLLLANALALNNDYQDAVETLEQLLGLMPGEPHAVFFANLYRSAVGRHRDVFSSLQRIIPDSNLSIASAFLLGRACSELDDPMTARELFRKALENKTLDPVLRCDLRHALAEALEVEGWTEEARNELEIIHEQYPDFRPMFARFSITEVEAKPPTPKAVKESTGTGPVALKEPEKAPEDSAPRSIASDASGPLHLVSSDGKKDIVLDKPSITIGREEGDIVLGGDTAASRLHAQISKDDEGRVYVEDLGSTNGTWVNQHRVGRKVELHRGDWLQVGETTFQLR